MTTLDLTFTAALGRVRPCDTWICVQMPDSATVFGTRGLVSWRWATAPISCR